VNIHPQSRQLQRGRFTTKLTIIINADFESSYRLNKQSEDFPLEELQSKRLKPLKKQQPFGKFFFKASRLKLPKPIL
jgi:hypothetical protein